MKRDVKSLDGATLYKAWAKHDHDQDSRRQRDHPVGGVPAAAARPQLLLHCQTSSPSSSSRYTMSSSVLRAWAKHGNGPASDYETEFL